MYSINILAKNRKRKNGTTPIYLEVSKDSKRIYLPIKYIDYNLWDYKKQCLKNRIARKSEIENYINKRKNKAIQVLDDLELKGTYSLEEFKVLYTGTKTSSVISFFNIVISEQTNKGNANAYRNCKGVVSKYNDNLVFSDINNKWLIDFENHLRLTNGNGGISFVMRTLRSLFNKAINRNLVSQELYPFKKYKIPKSTIKKIALTKDQIKDFKEFECSGQLELSKDIFMLSFFTQGMNMVDIYNLNKDNVVNGRIVYKRSKTSKVYSIKINSNIKQYLEKYETNTNNLFSFSDEYKTEKTLTRLVNFQIKKIIPNIIFYTARDSWANIANTSGIGLYVIKESLGHNDIKTTQGYLNSLVNSFIDDANDIVGDI